MKDRDTPSFSLQENRFSRQELIPWWDQSLMKKAKILVVGAGAIGNEALKNLAFLGVGNIAIVDMDDVEISNLSRSILFRETDRSRKKAVCASEAVRVLYPDIHVIPIAGNVLSDVGLGLFHWADIVVGALDNREARVFINKSCAQVGRPWIDGGIEALNGIVRGFAPPDTPCYECTMGETDWKLLNQRRGCSLLMKQAEQLGHIPNMITTASVIGAIQAQEVMKFLHGMEMMSGWGYVYEGETHQSYTVKYSRKKECPWHEPCCRIESVAEFNSSTPLNAVWDYAASRLGGLDALEFSREILASLHCSSCGSNEEIFQPVERISENIVSCRQCGGERVPAFFHSLHEGDERLHRTVALAGLPVWDIIWARKKARYLGVEMSGDCCFANEDGKDKNNMKEGASNEKRKREK